ncbi:biorientation of chromosomes in cell division protein 1-like 1 isoform X2 [Manduca sexta]|uniref:biorientation of chromosomes in cell division protein 1-like 1 isoform X2 n=1 Tax=Manduca sexta TaxID=7130 RepID=UPI001890A8E2|nr:biorientation of chromosomes in cell division protein 1-like 1 isoform X2 [Manduca sexta]
MAHLQYMPGDPRLVDQLVYELKSKGIFDQFRKECIADVDTRPAYQNLRQRVESSVSAFLSRQCWKPDLNKNQLREKLRKHILDGNYLEQGLERIVDQVVNPKVAPVFIPEVEDLVYNFLGVSRKKVPLAAETSTEKTEKKPEDKQENVTVNLLPTDLEAVSPGSVKSNDDTQDDINIDMKEESMEIDEDPKEEKVKEKEEDQSKAAIKDENENPESGQDMQLSNGSEGISTVTEQIDKMIIPLPDEIKPEDIPPPENSPPQIDLGKIELPKDNIDSLKPIDIPLPNESPKMEKENYFKPIVSTHTDEDESSSDSSLRRNMSPLTPIRNFINENSCDAQQGFENDTENKDDEKKEPSSFRFAIDAKSAENSSDAAKPEKKDEQANLAYQFNNQVNINNFNTPMYDDSSNSNNLQIDYESDANSKINAENKVLETENSKDSTKGKKPDEKRSSQKSSHRSRDSHRQSSSKDRRSDSKQSTSRDSSRHDKKSKDDRGKSKSSHRERERSKDRSDKKDSRDSSKHRSSHKSSSSSSKDSKPHRSSSSSQKHSSKNDDKKSSSSHRDKSDKSSDKSKDRKDSKSSSHRSDKDKKSSSKSKSDEKDKKKDKKDTDDHYSLSGRGNNTRRSTDRDSNDGSSSSKSSHNPPSSKSSENKNKESKESSSKSDNTSTSGESTSPSDKEVLLAQLERHPVNAPGVKPVRVDTHLEVPVSSPPRLPFVPNVTLKKPKFAANLKEAKKMMKMRKFLDEEQKRMNQEAALLLEFQANVRPSLSQVYSSIPGPELEFACGSKNQLEYQVIHRDSEESNSMRDSCQEVKIMLENLDAQAIKDIIGVTRHDEQNVEDSSTFDQPNEIDNAVTENVTILKDSEIKDEDNEDLGNEAVKSNENDGYDLKNVVESKTETYEENKPFSQLVDEIIQYGKASERMKMNNEKPNAENQDKARNDLFEVTIITEELSENEEAEFEKCDETTKVENTLNEPQLQYFDEQERIEADFQRHKFRNFLKRHTYSTCTNKMYLINCGTYEENIFKEVSATFGEYEIVNYHRNGHLKLPNKNIVKDVNLETEITLPVDSTEETPLPNAVFSPVKSECSFELSSDYDAKLEEMVNKTSRQEIMEIILGSAVDESPSKAPKINYCVDPFMTNDNVLKRKMNEVDSTMNNNKQVLTSNKIRKLSGSDQITSTTEDLPNSPSSDKSVENYDDSTPHTPNGKLKTPQRSKIQRYDTTDLYKPKLHYLSRRNNVS